MTDPALKDPLTFLHLPVDLRALYKQNDNRGWGKGSRPTFDEGRALHHALTEVFGQGSLQPFRLMVPPRGRHGAVYAYSALASDDLIENAKLSLPDMQAVFDLDALRLKPLSNHFTKGRRLGFDIRICPIRRTRQHKTRSAGRTREIDAFLHEALQHADDKNWMEKNGRTREAVYRQWLAEQLAPAAHLEDDVRMAHFHRIIKSRKDGVSQSPDAVMQGTMMITNEKAFADCLVKGIGRHKAYGFGMVLLRPAGMPPMKG